MVVLEVKVYPQSGRQELLLKEEKIHCYIKHGPEKGKANEEVLTLLAKKLALPPRSLCIMSGATTRNKLIKVATTLSKEELIKRIID